jgi:acyl carrier protein
MTAKDVIATALVNFLQSSPEAQGSIDVETDLLESGQLDSLRVMDLVCFLESHFQVKMQPADINPNNLRSVSRIAHYVLARAA